MTLDEHRLEKIEEQIDSLRNDVQEIKLAVARIEAKQCPSPGSCVPIASRLERLERSLVGITITALCGSVAFILKVLKS